MPSSDSNSLIRGKAEANLKKKLLKFQKKEDVLGVPEENRISKSKYWAVTTD